MSAADIQATVIFKETHSCSKVFLGQSLHADEETAAVAEAGPGLLRTMTGPKPGQ